MVEAHAILRLTVRSANFVVTAFVPLLAVLPATAQRIITTFAGTSVVFQGDGKLALNAALGSVTDLKVDPLGNPVLVDSINGFAARIDLSTANPILTVVAGNGFQIEESGDGGAARERRYFFQSIWLLTPRAVSTWATIVMCVKFPAASYGHSRGMKMDASLPLAGIGPAVNAHFYFPTAMTTDPAGNVYIADSSNFRVRKISTSGIITTIAGTPGATSPGDGGQATLANIHPSALAFDTGGNLYISDNASIRKVTPDGIISTVITGIYTGSLAVDPGGTLYFSSGSAIYKLSPVHPHRS